MLHHDGSVRGLSAGLAVGEVASPPLNTMQEVRQFIREYYPDEVNSSCGFHVHMSFSRLNYSRLTHCDFWNLFQTRMDKFANEIREHPGRDLLVSRLAGHNEYCQKNFRPEEQFWRTEQYGDRDRHPRYSQLNYCYDRHGTMECRVFPCFPRSETSILAFDALTGCVNAFLSRCRPERSHTLIITVQPPKHETIRQKVCI